MKLTRTRSLALLSPGILLAIAGCHRGPAAPGPNAHHYTPEEIRSLYMQRARSVGPGKVPGRPASAPAGNPVTPGTGN